MKSIHQQLHRWIWCILILVIPTIFILGFAAETSFSPLEDDTYPLFVEDIEKAAFKKKVNHPNMEFYLLPNPIAEEGAYSTGTLIVDVRENTGTPGLLVELNGLLVGSIHGRGQYYFNVDAVTQTMDQVKLIEPIRNVIVAEAE